MQAGMLGFTATPIPTNTWRKIAMPDEAIAADQVPKDHLDAARAAFENVMRGLPIEDQARLVSDWLAEAFEWRRHERGILWWAQVGSALHHFKLNDEWPGGWPDAEDPPQRPCG